MQGRYSLRDLRSVFVANELRNHLGGEYIAAERRWHFHTAESRADARAFLDRQPDVGVLHLHGLQHEAKAVKDMGGRFIRVRNHEGTYLDAHDLAVFRNEDAANACLAEVYSKFAATTRDLSALRLTFEPEAFAKPIDEALNGPIPPLFADIEKWNARISAFRKFRAPDLPSEQRSAAAAIDEATSVMHTLLDLTSEFQPQELPNRGDIAGVVVARSLHHVAVLVNEEGAGYLLPRDRLALPMRIDRAGELAIERGAPIHVNLETMEAIQNRRLAPDVARDLNRGPLVMTTRARAGAIEPILEFEFTVDGDLEGHILAENPTWGAVLDNGATATIVAQRYLGNRGIGSNVSMGPSFVHSSTARPLAASRSR